MGALIGMAAIFGMIGGALGVVVCLIACGSALWDLRKIARVARAKSVAIAELRPEDEVTVRGTIERALQPELPCFGGGKGLVVRHLVVTEMVGRRTHERVNETAGVRFLLRDPSGTVAVHADDVTGLALTGVGGGRPTRAVLEHTQGVYAWPNTPKTYVETGLRVGDAVLVRGVVEKNADGSLRIDRGATALTVIGGDGSLGATPEAASARALAIGAAISTVVALGSYFVLPLTRHMH